MKIKHWDVSVLGKKPAHQRQNMDFYTSDTDAHLRVKLTDADLNPATATFTLVNKDDASVVSEVVNVKNKTATYHMREQIINHAGEWHLQVVFHTSKSFTTRVIQLSVGGYLLDDKAPRLEVVENWNTLQSQVNDLIASMKDTQAGYSEQLGRLDERIDDIITTSAEGINEQEIIDARDGEVSLGKNLRSMKATADNQRADHAGLAKELTSHKQAVAGININQEARQTAEGRRVVSLPKTASEGHGQFGLKGLTDENGVSVNGNVRVKSVGKNLFDDGMEIGYIDENTGRNHSFPNWIRNKGYIKVDSERDYYLSFFVDGVIGKWTDLRKIYMYDENKKFISSKNNNIYTSNKVAYIRLAIRRTSNVETLPFIERGSLQLEVDSLSTSYEPYKLPSTLYLNAPKLRSLPNGVADEVRPDGRGGYEVVKRVGHADMKDSGFDKLGITTSSGYRAYRSKRLVKDLNHPVGASVWAGGYYLYRNDTRLDMVGYTTDELKDINDYVLFTGYPNDMAVDIVADEGKSFEEQFGKDSHTLVYELEDPIITRLNTSGELITRLSGTVYVEDVIADVATYADKITTEQPIKEIDQLSIVDYETGVEQELDVSQAVVAGDKLSFTHPELKNNDIVFVEYYLDVESTDGLASVEYFDSRYTIKDSATDKFYNWNIGITNGEPSIKLEEI